MDEIYNKYYATLDASGCIVGAYSDLFRVPQPGDVCIDEHGRGHLRLTVDGVQSEDNPPLFDGMSNIPLYKWDGAQVSHRTKDEIEADRKAAQQAAEAAEAERVANSPEARLDALELALCEADEATEAWKNEIENALCELDGGEN